MHEIRGSLKITLGFAGMVVGAGFSSGQEILQFFTNFGTMGIIGAVLCTVLFVFLGREICASSFALKTTSYKALAQHFCGRYLGWLVDILLTVILFAIFTVMIAGGGSLLNQYLGLPSPYGGLLITLLTLSLTGLSVRRLIIAVGALVPLLLVLVVVISIYALQHQSSNYASLEVFALAQTNRSASHWLISAALYVSYNLATAAPFLMIMGGQAATRQTALLGSTFGALLLGVLILLIWVALFTQLGIIGIFPIPMLALAQMMSPTMGILMIVAILGMIVSTALACLYPLLTRHAMPGTPRFRWIAGLASLLGLIMSSQGFVPLLSFIYPVLGVLGMVLIAAIFVHWVKARLEQLR